MVVLIAVIAAATLFPETYIVEFPLIGTQWTFPLTLLLPVVLVTSLLMVVRARRTIGIYPVDMLMIAYSLFLLARNVNGDYSFFTVKYVFISLSVYYLAAVVAEGEESLKRVFFSLSAVLVVICLYGLVEFVAQENILLESYISVEQPADTTHRVGAFLGHPVVFGAVLVQLIPFSIFMWVRGWKPWLRLFGLGATLLAVVCLLLTFSKGSWIAAFLVAVGATIYFVRTRGKRSVTIAMILLLMVSVFAGLYVNRSTFEDIVRFDTSVDARTISWEAAIDGIGKDPVIGVGLKEGEEEIQELIPESIKELYKEFKPPTDNYYLNVFLEGGIIGGLLWVSLIVLIVVGGYRQVMKKSRSRYMLVAAYISILGLMVNMVTFDAMLIWPNLILFWLAAGILRGFYGLEGGSAE